VRTETLDRSAGGMWAWLGQRVTAVVILVTIMVHLVLTHFVAIGELSYDNIGERLAVGRRPTSGLDRWAVNLPWTIYLGWITVATITNVAVVLAAAGFDGAGIEPDQRRVPGGSTQACR